MDLERVILELRLELKQLDQAIFSLENLSTPGPKRKGRPPKWMGDPQEKAAPDLDRKSPKRRKVVPDGEVR